MSRRYPTAELYDERQREFYRNGDRTSRNYEDLDLEISHSHNPRRSAPDLFRDDFDSRPTQGAMVVRERREEEITRTAPARRREVESDTLVIRGGRAAPPPPASSVREIERDDITIRHGARDGGPRRGRETEETDITIRHRDQSRPRPEPPREVEREDILFRRGDGARPGRREVEFEREEVRFKGRSQSRPREVEREEYHFHRDHSHHRRDTEIEKDTLVIRGRERSLPPPRRGELVAREHEEFIVRRRDPTPPPPRDMVTKDEIIIRRREARSPSPPPPPPPPPEPEPIVKPPIIQEIITHHRHIDHGVERARSPTPPPPPPSPPREEQLEISIRRRDSRGVRGFEEDIIYERETFDRPEPVKSKPKDMWTEITKDLVIKDAIDAMGYECEETDQFFYVMDYLKYEDVLQLVEISDDIRRKRKSRIRQIEYERSEIRRPASDYDRFSEHEVIYDRHSHRYR